MFVCMGMHACMSMCIYVEDRGKPVLLLSVPTQEPPTPWDRVSHWPESSQLG